MRVILAIAALLPTAAFAATCGGHGTRETTFVTTQWLADHLKDKNLVILAIGADQKQFEEAHIPGSVFFDYRDSHEKSPAGLATELPPMDVLASEVERFASISMRSRATGDITQSSGGPSVTGRLSS